VILRPNRRTSGNFGTHFLFIFPEEFANRLMPCPIGEFAVVVVLVVFLLLERKRLRVRFLRLIRQFVD